MVVVWIADQAGALLGGIQQKIDGQDDVRAYLPRVVVDPSASRAVPARAVIAAR